MAGKKIFIVDDTDFVVDMLRTIVQDAGHQVVGTAFDGESALESIEGLSKEQRPDILMIDFHMSKMDGLETSEKVRSIIPCVKIFLISSHATKSVATQARSIGVDAFIVKPFEPQTLLDAIHKL